ncbi:MAG: hypothetical protein ACO4CU_13960 [Ilumatobacteraceae bacterium]
MHWQGLRSNSRTRRSALVMVCAVLGGCGGGPEFTYLESDDGHVFAKIPADWEVDRAGAVDYTLVTKDNGIQFAFTPGDSTQPWRADFSADGPAGDAPTGFVEAQHLDARVREEFRLGTFIDQQRAEYDDYNRRNQRRDGLVGYRVTFTVPGDEPVVFEETWYMDERRSAVYRAAVSCSPDCAAAFDDDIDEILDTFTVVP